MKILVLPYGLNQVVSKPKCHRYKLQLSLSIFDNFRQLPDCYYRYLRDRAGTVLGIRLSCAASGDFCHCWMLLWIGGGLIAGTFADHYKDIFGRNIGLFLCSSLPVYN